jgi:hypothetical protein
VNDAVAYNGSSYISIQAGTNQEPDISSAFWSLLSEVGATGATGPSGPQGPIGATGEAGISWQGIWSAATTYQANNAVAYNGSIYFSIQGGK